MAKRFDFENGIILVTSQSVEDFHEVMSQLVAVDHVLYSPMTTSLHVDGVQEIGQMVARMNSTLSYFLIVAQSPEQLADRIASAREQGWETLFASLEMDGKYLQWVGREVDPKVSIGKVLIHAFEEMIDEFSEMEKMRAHWVGAGAVEPFDGVFVKSIQKMDLVARGS